MWFKLTRYSFFRNLSCSPANLLMVEADNISMVLNISGVTRTIAFDILIVFSQDTAYNWSALQGLFLLCLWSDVSSY